MGNTVYFSFEPVFMEWLQSLLGDGGATLFTHLSALGEQYVMVLILGFLYWCYDKKFGIYVGTNIVIGLTFNPLIKNIFLRRRPYFDHSQIKCLRPVEPKADIYDIGAQGYSFPSGHSMNSAITYGSLGRYGKRRWLTVIAFTLPLLVGLSRVVAGVHYPTDVLVGWGVGALIVFFVPAIYDRFGEDNRCKVNLVFFLISATGVFYCTTEDYFTSLGIMAGFFVGIEFEKRLVGFSETTKPVECIIRLFGGLLIYLVLNTLLKLPFSSEFLDSATTAAYLVRTLRYSIVIFTMIGPYPLLFKFIKTDKQS